jgi:hypothetical protein
MTCSELSIQQNVSLKSTKIRQVSAPKPSAIIETFNTWAFKRHQPDNVELLLEKVDFKVRAHQSLQFLLYWGKGPRHSLGEAELRCLEFIASMTRRIGQTYPAGGKFTLILTDTHARLNGHAAANIDAYFAEVAAAAADYGFSTCRLSELVDRLGDDRTADAQVDPRADPIFDELVKSASKWYFGDGCPELGADLYYRANMVEKRAVEAAFPEAIFVTFNGPEFRVLFPQSLPIFYMYSLKRGCAVKPWFMSEPGATTA